MDDREKEKTAPPTQFSRTELLFGREAVEKLAKCRVAVFGIGGVGGYAVEALARSGVGTLDLIDGDRFALTNLNRQLHAVHSTLGRYKVEVAAERVKDINPEAAVHAHRAFFLPENAEEFDFSAFDYVVDAIDTVKGKIALAVCAQTAGTPVISAMGAGNKVDPTAFEVADLYETSVCPLARVMRYECRKRGIRNLKVVYSKELPLTPRGDGGEAPPTGRRQIPGSNAFVPPVVGLILAGEVVKDLIRSGPGTPPGPLSAFPPPLR